MMMKRKNSQKTFTAQNAEYNLISSMKTEAFRGVKYCQLLQMTHVRVTEHARAMGAAAAAAGWVVGTCVAIYTRMLLTDAHFLRN